MIALLRKATIGLAALALLVAQPAAASREASSINVSPSTAAAGYLPGFSDGNGVFGFSEDEVTFGFSDGNTHAGIQRGFSDGN